MKITVNIKKHFGDFDLNMDLDGTSSRIGILGASGCGKSMTLKAIAGIVTPDEGHIEIDGRVVFDSEKKINLKPQQRNIGYLFQNYALFPTMTVEKNIEAGLKGSKEEKRLRVAQMISKFELQGLEKRYPEQLSGGQQQRVALARIMAYEPDVILLDEPFSALDVFLKDKLQQELIEMLSDYQGMVIMVSHDRDEIYRFSEELLIMDRGEPVIYGKTKDLFRDPKKTVAAKLTGCKNITPIERKDDHHAYLPEWKVELEMEQKIPEDVNYMGYRAHFFEPVWEKPECTKNLMKIQLESLAELPFEWKYYLRPKNHGQEPNQMQNKSENQELDPDIQISWFVQKSAMEELKVKGSPEFLLLKEEAMMFLRGENQ